MTPTGPGPPPATTSPPSLVCRTTGASGAAVAAFLRGAPSPITVVLDGGELTVEISDDLDVTLIGAASRVYAGELDAAFVGELA